MNEVVRRLYRELYRKSLYDFVKDFWNTSDPSKFVDGKLVKYYCEVFQYFCRRWMNYDEKEIALPKVGKDEVLVDIRQGKQNLCLNVPPRHTKSKIFNVFGPVWLWLNNPIKAVSISHTGGLATEMNAGRYAIINSEKFQYFFSDITLTTNSSSLLRDNRGGELRSLNRNAFTGYGGDVIINDDLTNAETARKDQAEMGNAWSYYRNTMPSRINDINKCIIMNIQQRLAPNDITGHIMADEKLAKTYTFIVMPAIFEKTTYYVCPISGDIICWKKGETLWPERFGDYNSLKDQVGLSVFETQYLQKPVATDKTIVKEDMITSIDELDAPKILDADMIYASHDFPVKDKDTSDFLGSILAYKVGATLYIKDCLEKRMAFVKSVNYVEQLDTMFPGVIQVIEDKANGSPILQQLQDKVPGMQAYQPGTHSKYQRLESASLYLTSKNIVFIKSKFNKLTQTYEYTDAMQNLITRLLNFPFVEHDDIVDAFSQLVLFVFMDRRFMVYGRAFTDNNIVDIKATGINSSYSTIFFNKEGDIWKAMRIHVVYGAETKLYVTDEIQFKASPDDAMIELKKFAKEKSVAIDCSATDAMYGVYNKSLSIERYEINDFDKSVAQLSLAFSKKLVLVDKSCHYTKNDIESFKFNKTKDETAKYVTTKDGLVACLRVALKFYGGIV